MSCSEFHLIRRFFSEQRVQREDVPLGIGDDAALLVAPPGQHLVVSIDSLVGGIHFPQDTSACAVGHKALAVNLSDLAAMGAEPAWATLALSLPQADEAWLGEFAQGFFALARAHGVQLVGGDTTRGPMSVTVQVSGFVPPGQALTRQGAAPGDGLYVTGRVGEAGLGLRLYQHDQGHTADAERFIHRLEYPTPRIAAGLVLRGRASSTIDVSDGLAADLGHILQASGVGADVSIAALPLAEAQDPSTPAEGWQFAVSAGDDYELCFTLPPGQEGLLAELDCPCTRIGEISATPGLRWYDTQGRERSLEQTGFEHFGSGSA